MYGHPPPQQQPPQQYPYHHHHAPQQHQQQHQQYRRPVHAYSPSMVSPSTTTFTSAATSSRLSTPNSMSYRSTPTGYASATPSPHPPVRRIHNNSNAKKTHQEPDKLKRREIEFVDHVVSVTSKIGEFGPSFLYAAKNDEDGFRNHKKTKYLIKATAAGTMEEARRAEAEVRLFRRFRDDPTMLHILDCGFSTLEEPNYNPHENDDEDDQALPEDRLPNRRLYCMLFEPCPETTLTDFIAKHRRTEKTGRGNRLFRKHKRNNNNNSSNNNADGTTSNGFLPIGLILRLFDQMARSVATLQEFDDHPPPQHHGFPNRRQAGILHLDLKPGRFLVRDMGGDYQVKLCSFGCAIRGRLPLRNQEDTQIAAFLIDSYTTLVYRAPEMIHFGIAEDISGSADVWGLGCCFFAMLFMKDCFSPDNKQDILAGKYRIPHSHPYTPAVLDLLNRMITVEPFERAGIMEVLHCIDALKRDGPLPPRRGSMEPRSHLTATPDADPHNVHHPFPPPQQQHGHSPYRQVVPPPVGYPGMSFPINSSNINNTHEAVPPVPPIPAAANGQSDNTTNINNENNNNNNKSPANGGTGTADPNDTSGPQWLEFHAGSNDGTNLLTRKAPTATPTMESTSATPIFGETPKNRRNKSGTKEEDKISNWTMGLVDRMSTRSLNPIDTDSDDGRGIGGISGSNGGDVLRKPSLRSMASKDSTGKSSFSPSTAFEAPNRRSPKHQSAHARVVSTSNPTEGSLTPPTPATAAVTEFTATPGSNHHAAVDWSTSRTMGGQRNAPDRSFPNPNAAARSDLGRRAAPSYPPQTAFSSSNTPNQPHDRAFAWGAAARSDMGRAMPPYPQSFQPPFPTAPAPFVPVDGQFPPSNETNTTKQSSSKGASTTQPESFAAWVPKEGSVATPKPQRPPAIGTGFTNSVSFGSSSGTSAFGETKSAHQRMTETVQQQHRQQQQQQQKDPSTNDKKGTATGKTTPRASSAGTTFASPDAFDDVIDGIIPMPSPGARQPETSQPWVPPKRERRISPQRTRQPKNDDGNKQQQQQQQQRLGNSMPDIGVEDATAPSLTETRLHNSLTLDNSTETPAREIPRHKSKRKPKPRRRPPKRSDTGGSSRSASASPNIHTPSSSSGHTTAPDDSDSTPTDNNTNDNSTTTNKDLGDKLSTLGNLRQPYNRKPALSTTMEVSIEGDDTTMEPPSPAAGRQQLGQRSEPILPGSGTPPRRSSETMSASDPSLGFDMAIVNQLVEEAKTTDRVVRERRRSSLLTAEAIQAVAEDTEPEEEEEKDQPASIGELKQFASKLNHAKEWVIQNSPRQSPAMQAMKKQGFRGSLATFLSRKDAPGLLVEHAPAAAPAAGGLDPIQPVDTVDSKSPKDRKRNSNKKNNGDDSNDDENGTEDTSKDERARTEPLIGDGTGRSGQRLLGGGASLASDDDTNDPMRMLAPLLPSSSSPDGQHRKTISNSDLIRRNIDQLLASPSRKRTSLSDAVSSRRSAHVRGSDRRSSSRARSSSSSHHHHHHHHHPQPGASLAATAGSEKMDRSSKRRSASAPLHDDSGASERSRPRSQGAQNPRKFSPQKEEDEEQLVPRLPPRRHNSNVSAGDDNAGPEHSPKDKKKKSKKKSKPERSVRAKSRTRHRKSEEDSRRLTKSFSDIPNSSRQSAALAHRQEIRRQSTSVKEAFDLTLIQGARR